MNNLTYKTPTRLSFPSSEASHSWLGIVLDAYHIADRGVAEAIARAERQGKKLACAKGCSSCCATHIHIPVYPIELVGMSWYATEKTEGPVREKLKAQLASKTENNACAFLVDGACAIHPLRPMACRHFNVFQTPCAQGEDAYYTRRRDVLKPIKKYKNEALKTTLPFYKVSEVDTIKRMIKGGGIHLLVKDLRAIDWKSLAQKMAEFHRTKAP
jgi:Fe-S-cluster containining protein